jgi:outer membrane lipoprotein LolB
MGYVERMVRVFVLFAIIFIAGCASITRVNGTFPSKDAFWQGRLALTVHSTPVQAFSANFELQGNAQAGSLVLSTMLGSTLARIQWTDTTATLISGNDTRAFDSLPMLLRHTLGTDLPVASLFAWLQGQAATAPEWEVDLTQLDQGRLNARRTSLVNPAELKIILAQ